ncbi:DUF350 domain-containing protein [Paenibacillus sp. J31TS4]|uniref:DUF350 domain-containing protein n=1 Tax=Paenibacillus sp. J31TS4 TaxID=2807195 RepID=UPI001B15A6C7|nr:DUF350 domain-containing protein [Paenibacillus sp. J31TS4]GIP40332.1 DUF350 domain-containing protein [Paenibacillus sp. J31TS4]
MLTQWDAIMNFLLYLGVTVPMLALGMFVFMLTTPYNEYKLIKEATVTSDPAKLNAAKAAAHDLGGKMIGHALVLASAVYHSLGIGDLLLWGVLGIVFQVLIFYIFEWVTPFSVVKEIPKGNVSVGIFTSRVSLASGLLMAALISY